MDPPSPPPPYSSFISQSTPFNASRPMVNRAPPGAINKGRNGRLPNNYHMHSLPDNREKSTNEETGRKERYRSHVQINYFNEGTPVKLFNEENERKTPVKPLSPVEIVKSRDTPPPLPVKRPLTKQTLKLKSPVKRKEKINRIEYAKAAYRVIKREVKNQILKHPFLSGSVILLVVLIMFLGHKPFIRFMIGYFSKLEKGSLFTMFAFEDPPVGLNVCIYAFSLKNGKQFLAGARPHLEEVGPFCFNAHRNRRIVKWTKYKTARFIERFKLVHTPHNSLPLSTKFKLPNLLIFGGASVTNSILEILMLKWTGPLINNAVVQTLRLSGEPMIEELSAYELFYRREINLLKYADTWLFTPLRSIGIAIPTDLGLFSFHLNGPSFGVASLLGTGEVGPFEVHTTTTEEHLIGDAYSAFNRSTVPLKGAPCNVIGGGEGYFWRRPFHGDQLTLWIYYFCRLLVFTKEYTHYFWGSWVSHFTLDTSMWNYSGIRENSCHCLKDDPRECDGWMNLRACFFGVPVGFTLPHFHQSPKQLAKVRGLKPDPERHSFFLEFENELGIPIYGYIALQLVLDIGPLWGVPQLANIQAMQYPIVWLTGSAGAIGILGGIIFVFTAFVHYGMYIWLLGGLAISMYLFNYGIKQRNTSNRS